MAASLAAAKDINMDAAVKEVFWKMGGTAALKEQGTTLKAVEYVPLYFQLVLARVRLNTSVQLG